MQQRRHPVAVRAVRPQEREEPVAQGPARPGAEGEHPGEVAGFRRRDRPGRLVGQQARGVRRGEVEDVVADRDAGPARPAGRREHAERQVLDREVRVPVGPRHAAADARVVGVVEIGPVGGRHQRGSGRFGSKCFSSLRP